MNLRLQSALLFGIAMALVAGTLLFPRADVRGQAATKLPIVEEKKHKSYDEQIAEFVKLEMVAIPGGTFLMGSPDSEKEREAVWDRIRTDRSGPDRIDRSPPDAVSIETTRSGR